MMTKVEKKIDKISSYVQVMDDCATSMVITILSKENRIFAFGTIFFRFSRGSVVRTG